MITEINCIEFANLFNRPFVFFNRDGVLIDSNKCYKENYHINDFDDSHRSLFEIGLLSTEHRQRLDKVGKIALNALLADGQLTKSFPSKRLIENRFLSITIVALTRNGMREGYALSINDDTSQFNSRIDDEERNLRWRNISLLGKEAYWQYDINTSSWVFSDNFFKLTGASVDREINNDLMDIYLDTVNEQDRDMLREQWGLSIVDSREGDIFEYTYQTHINGDLRYHSCRWIVDNSTANPVIYGLIMDFTELSKTELALRDSLTQMSLLSAIDSILVWSYNSNTAEFLFNKEICNEKVLHDLNLYGDSVSLEKILSLVHPDDIREIKEGYNSVVSGENFSIILHSRIKNQNDNYIFVVTNFVLQKSYVDNGLVLLAGLSRLSFSENEISAESTLWRTNMDDKKTILIAEDIDNNYDLLNIILRKDYKLVRAVNGIEAVRLFSEVKPDIILMDMKMPEMGGLEATRLIRMESSEVPIIAVTAFAFESDREVAIEAGCNDFLSKPIDIPVLKSLIKRFLSA